MITTHSIQKYFELSNEVLYNSTNDGSWFYTIPQFRWQRPDTISMQEIEFYLQMAENMLYEYFNETLVYTQKFASVAVDNIIDARLIDNIIGKRFATGINYYVTFGQENDNLVKSSAITRFPTDDLAKMKFFVLFESPFAKTTSPKTFTVLNKDKVISPTAMQSNPDRENYVFTGDAIDLIKREIVEDTSFANQDLHDLRNNNIYTDTLSLIISVIDPYTPSGKLYIGKSRYDVWLENDSAGIAKITKAIRLPDEDTDENKIDFHYVSSIANKGVDLHKVNDALCMLFGSLIPLNLVKQFPTFYNKCKILQVDTAKKKSWYNKVDYQYIYNPFGTLFGQVETQKLLESMK